MPVYRWKGLDAGNILHQGITFSISQERLSEQLLEKDIALLEAQSSLLPQKFTESFRQHFFNQLASLIQSHIPLYNALIIIASTCKKAGHKAILENIAELVSQGAPLHDALTTHGLSDEFSKTVLMVSEQTGALGAALQVLADHYAYMAELKAKLRSAFMGPAITFFFFIVILLALFIFVIPQFERYFLSYNAALPTVTSCMLAISRCMRSPLGIGMMILISLIIIFGLYAARRYYKRGFDELLFGLPFISSALRALYTARVLKIMGMLLERGVPLSRAFNVCIETIVQHRARQELCAMQAAIEDGSSLLSVWKRSLFASAEIEAYIAMGESTGQLGLMLDRAGRYAVKKIYASLNRVAALLQPILMFVLGVCVAALIVAVYMPLLTLSEIAV